MSGGHMLRWPFGLRHVGDTRTETESFEDQYVSSYDPDDYGND